MKIYCGCYNCKIKIYLDSDVKTKKELLNNWGIIFTIVCKKCKYENRIHVNDVIAERSIGKTGFGAFGGAGGIGLIGGPIGAIIGLIGGGITGVIIDLNDKEKVKIFNGSNV
jgi:hypothetical protein